jgi:lysophospholipase
MLILLKDWIRIATEIELNYTFDAFVILHGTDTMAYTSSALSFLLEDLGKTVVRKDFNILYTQVMTALDIDRSPNPSIAIAK